jgi:hypothetical protein
LLKIKALNLHSSRFYAFLKLIVFMKNLVFFSFFMGSLAILAFSTPSVSPPPDAQKETSLKAFDTMLKVLKHERCMNCHPSDDRPRQGDDAHVHLFGVQRGKDDKGLPVLRCNACHQSENNIYSNVPGAPNWHLAPKSMGWQGLTDAQLGKALLDKTKNGNRSVAQLVEHMTKDALVQWAWQPGEGRNLPPVGQADFHAAVKTWAENGAQIPE